MTTNMTLPSRREISDEDEERLIELDDAKRPRRGEDGHLMLTAYAADRLKEIAPSDGGAGPRFLSYGYYVSGENGVGYQDGKKDAIPLCGPVEVLALSRDARGEDAGVLLRWVDLDGRTHDFVVANRDLVKDPTEVAATLSSMGLRIGCVSGKTDHANLARYFLQAKVHGRVRTVAATGWNGIDDARAFVLPDHAYGGKDEVFRLRNSPDQNPYRTQGTVAEWRREVGQLCIGNARLLLAVSAAFSAPLLDFVGLTGIGVHFVGPSQRGKTSAARVAASVCGDKNYLHSWRGTDNSFESRAVNHCDAAFILDEIGVASDRAVGDIIYAVVNGHGKGRSNRDGSHKKEATWRVALISTGEKTLEQKMAEAGKKPAAGQEVRLLNLEIDPNSTLGIFGHIHGMASAREFSDRLKAATESFYGTPFRAFIAALVHTIKDDPEFVRRRYAMMRDAFLKNAVPDGASPQVESAAKVFALIAAAGEIATDFGITGWEPRHAAFAADVCFRAWLANRGGIEDLEVERGIAQVRAFIEANGNSRFDTIQRDTKGKESIDQKQKTVARVGFRRRQAPAAGEVGVWEYLVLPGAWDREVCKGFDSGRIAKEMIRRGMMRPNKDPKRQNVQLRVPGEKVTRYYVVWPAD